MRFAIDWFSTLLFLAAYAFSQIRAVPPRIGYGALTIACVVIAIYRYRMASSGINLLFVAIALAAVMLFWMPKQ